MLKVLQIIKNILILFPVLLVLRPFKQGFLFISYLIDMNIWILKNKHKVLLKNPLKITRDYNERFKLYEQVSSHFSIETKNICYLEFGVASGNSFKWWVAKNSNDKSNFFGFDTFEGLPEDWGGFYKKGDMASPIPQLEDKRTLFLKGLFQETVTEFIDKNSEKLKTAEMRIIHCDADLYSATIFVLSQMFPFMKKGDIILFDEFNVPTHEYKAFKEFTENFYVNLRPIAQVNTFYQTAFVVE